MDGSVAWSWRRWAAAGVLALAALLAVSMGRGTMPRSEPDLDPVSQALDGEAPTLLAEAARGLHLWLDYDYKAEAAAAGRPAAGEDYPVVDQSLLAEPGRATTLSVSVASASVQGPLKHLMAPTPLSDSSDLCLWAISPLLATSESPAFRDASAWSRSTRGTSIEVTFPAPGQYQVEVSCEVRGEVLALSQTVSALYVRRELRSLSEEDRDKFLDAVHLMSVLSTEEGQAQYGKFYYQLDYFVTVHTTMAGSRRLDHMHDGLGLLTQHIALSNAFERSLQAIDSSIALPYWDYTLDMHNVKKTSGSNDISLIFKQSELFSDKWFGKTHDMRHTIVNGRFAWQQVASNLTTGTHSPYGFLRAPWNLNPSPFVTRYHKMCGMEATKLLAYEGANFDSTSAEKLSFQWPTCASHHKLVSLDSWYDFTWTAGYLPHGPVHSWIGGVGGDCESIGDDAGLAELVHKADVTILRSLMFVLLKNLWRSFDIEVPTYCSRDAGDCTIRCNVDTRKDTLKGIANQLELLLGIANTTYSLDQLAVIADSLVCGKAFWPGDHLEAASPAEASFWPIHPTLERLVHYKLLYRPFTDMEWIHESTSDAHVCARWSSTDCHGHNPEDLTFWPIVHLGVDGSFRDANVKNVELRGMADMDNYRLPYIYDHFRWEHCEEDGVVFETSSASAGS
uniref:Tyrosinase copper-binding domain-containing protein n=1 Tax=Rhizochromulina marina TaxID=1034831 RepID=A0A7S2W4W4_9STRA|mmetsp:Transcript_14141/g.41629  ORF Transcript_14141/g.41629 Transcript_14141/m.41629 type:complete len:677 (+) Transcript_14141:113-2143(+)